MRTCVGCRRTAPGTELIRLSRTVAGALALGPGPGRGAWLCAPPQSVRCLDQASQRRALDRALRCTIGDDEVARVRAKLDDMSG